MRSALTKFASMLAVATAVIVASNAGVSAQSVDEIRAKCIGLAGNNNLTGNPEDARGRARLSIYSDCMRQHGLTP